MASDDVPTAAVLPSLDDETPRRIGPFDVQRDSNTLTLRAPDRGEIGFNGCLFFAGLTVFVMALGVLALFQAATQSQTLHQHLPNNPAPLLEPPGNHFGFLWGVSIAALVVGVPLYVRRAYHSALVFTFRRSDDSFCRGAYRVARLSRVEYVALRETLDPDERYLYHLDIFYGDGREIELHCGYNEREVMNLANEIGAFVGKRVVWKS